MKKLVICLFMAVFLVGYAFFAYSLPTATIENEEITHNQIEFDYSLIDTDLNMLMHTQEYYSNIEILEGDEIITTKEIQETENEHIVFSNLKSDTDYTVNINAPYDLKGLNQEPYNQAPYTILSKTFKTSKNTLTGEITTTKAYANSIDVEYDFVDEDQVDDNAVLEIKGEQSALIPTEKGNYLFKNLEKSTSYEIVLSYQGEVLDQETVVTKEEKEQPDSEFEEPNIDGNTLDIDYDLFDPDNSFIINGAVGPTISLFGGLFGGLISVTDAVVGGGSFHVDDIPAGDYTLIISGQYDLNGDGIPDNEEPYIIDEIEITIEGEHIINSCDELQQIGSDQKLKSSDTWDLDDDYKLAKDIDCSKTNFTTIENSFTGYLNGENHKITKLHGDQFSGLFNEIGSAGGVIDLEINTNDETESKLGILSVDNYGTIKNVSTTGSITGLDDIAGIVHNNNGNMYEVSSNVSITANNNVGGLVVENNNTLSGDFTGVINAKDNVGGISATNNLDIYESSCDLTIHANDNVGGIVANNYGTLNQVNCKGQINANDNVGAIAGVNNYDIIDSYSDTILSANNNVGGLIGINEMFVTNSYSLGQVSGLDAVGGLVGTNNGDIDNTYSNSVVTSENKIAGGLVGVNTADIENSYALGNTNGGNFIGVLKNDGDVYDSFATGDSSKGFIYKEVNHTGNIADAYTYEDALCTNNCNVYKEVSLIELSDKNWYENVIDFDKGYNLDNIENGFYPHLKSYQSDEIISGQVAVELPKKE